MNSVFLSKMAKSVTIIFMAMFGLSLQTAYAGEGLNLYWSSAGKIPGKVCTQIVEVSPASWNDNYVCADRDYGFAWAYAGPIAGMTCSPFHENDPAWADNYFCAPANSKYKFEISLNEKPMGASCLAMPEAMGGKAWTDNYLCWEKKVKPPLKAGIVTVNRKVFRADYYDQMQHGQALLGLSVNNDSGIDLAFALLNDSLATAVQAGAAAASGGSSAASSNVTGVIIGEGISKITGALRDTDKQLPKLAKFGSAAPTYLQFDDGSWCHIKTGEALGTIETDSLEPMTRYDIPNNAAHEKCGWPDAFYQAPNGTIFFAYSSKASNPSWQGIGFGDSYCAVKNEPQWLNYANYVFKGANDIGNIRQASKFIPNNISDALARRINRGVCPDANLQWSQKSIFMSPKASRTILYNDHWKKSGHGAALHLKAKSDNPMGDFLTDSNTQIVAGLNGIPFSGTGAQILSMLSDEDVALSKMVKRPTSDVVYLQYDDNSWCFMKEPELLGIMKADEIEVAKSNNIPSNVQANRVPACTYPDGFFKTDTNAKVYYLFSSQPSNEAWYGIGFGDSYCKIDTEANWRKIIKFAGGDGARPQNSLHRISDTKFLEGRSEKTCPTAMVNGVVAGR